MIFYRIIFVIVSPVLTLVFGYRWLRGKETRAGLAERLALGAATAPAPTIWLHAASLGELTAARPLISAILVRWPELRVVATMNSYTGRALVRNWQDPRILARMAPLDSRGAARRFCRQWAPLALISVENELWPNRLACCAARGIPVLIAGGRISDSARTTWARFPALARASVAAVDHLAPLDARAAEAFVELGMDRDRVGQMLQLKSAVALADPAPGELERLSQRFERRRTVLAASTHEGEDAPILHAFLKARQHEPRLQLILAPRHPARGDDIARLLRSLSLDFDRRSDPGPDHAAAPVLLADTLGEMALWYSLAGTTLIGGTWAAKGGHTPFEPAQFGSTVVHGPSTSNHAEAFAALAAAKAGIAAATEAEIAKAILDLCQPGRQQALEQAATRALAAMRAETTGIEAFIDRLATLTQHRQQTGAPA